MIGLGVDPSTDGFSYACVDMSRGAQFMACGDCKATPKEMRALFRDLRPAYVAIETIIWIHSLPARHALGRTSRTVGRVGMFSELWEEARMDPEMVLEFPMAEWRGALIGKGMLRQDRAVQDAAVKTAITTRVRDWPARSNNHVRDACGIALYGYQIALGRKALQQTA